MDVLVKRVVFGCQVSDVFMGDPGLLSGGLFEDVVADDRFLRDIKKSDVNWFASRQVPSGVSLTTGMGAFL